jgi:hypothetical protein
MSPENNFAVISTIAAVLVLIFSVETSRREEDSIIQAYEFASLPFGVVLLLLIAFVIFYWVLPLAEMLDRPALWGLGIGVLGLLLVLALFWFRSRLSLDWGLGSGVSIALGAGGVLSGEAGRKRSVRLSLSQVAIITGLLAIAVNFVLFAMDVLIIQFP